jgi:tyrosine-protein phosphatase SIW14
MRLVGSHFFFFALLSFSTLISTASVAQVPPDAPSSATVRSAYGEKLRLSGLPNGGKINDSLFRGAQPRGEGVKELKILGITTIVDLRGEDPATISWERGQAERLGIRFISIPVSGWSPPSNEQVALFLEIFRDHPKEKVFVHCRFGDDRTGVFVATYRMAFNGWPAAQAMNEMYFFGFNGFWHPSMKAFIRDFPARLRTAPALASFRNWSARPASGDGGSLPRRPASSRQPQ